jgi:predicted Zn finger-like uncharacterized protein
MVKVECDGCKAPYQIDEKRIPPTGLKMRCPKCGTNILVTKPGAAPGGADADLPAVASRDLPAVVPPRAGKPPAGPPPRPGAPPRPPPPRGAQAKADEIPDFDVEPDEDRPATRSGFGEIDLMVDLPAPDADHGQSDLPAVRGPAPLAGFGDVDLPDIHDGNVVDLPAVPGGGRGGGFGEIDLPMAPAAGFPAAAPAPPRGAPPQRVRGRTVNFGDIDLPSVPDGMDLPMVGRGFGEIDLPLTADDHAGLPEHAQGAGLPAPAYGAGLPAPAYGAGLPAPAYGAGLPAPAYGAGLPAPAYGAGLPAPAQGGGLPMPAQGSGLPMAMPGGGLPMSAQGGGLPMAMPGGGLPMSAQGSGLPMTGHGNLPMHVPGGGLPEVAHPHGEMSLGGEEMSLGPNSRSNAFDDSDRANPAQMTAEGLGGGVGIDLDGPLRATVGDEAELSSEPAVGEGADPGAPAQRRPREAEGPAKRGNARQVGLAAAVLFVIGGAAMTLVPSIGPFGMNFIADKVNASGYGAQLDELRKGISAQLEEDTSSAIASGLERCKAVQKTMPRYNATKAYCAYVAVDRGLRFGRRAEDEAYAKQLLKDGAAEVGPTAALVTAALDALGGQAAKASTATAALAAKAPTDVDVAVVAAEVELGAKSGQAAVTAWKRAVELKKSARTSYGLARAYAAVDNRKEAEAAARAAMAASPQHAGARMLLASLVYRDPGKEAEALTVLKQVTEPGTAGKTAGDVELVEAFTLLGRVHLTKSRISAAEQAFAAALKIDPLAVQALVGNGELFYRSGRFNEALSRYEAATKADPESVIAKVGTAKTFIALERMKEAKDLLKKMREAHASDPLVTLWLGKAEEVLGNKKEAEADYVEAIKIGENKPEAVDAYVALAHLLSGVGRNDDANAKLAEASKKFPDFPALHRAKGEVALQMGRYEEAKNEFEAALAREEDLASKFRLGVALRRMRKFDRAAEMFDKVAESDKDYPGLALERGLLFEETGQSDKALESYRQALQKAPHDVDLKLRVGSTQVIAGHAKEAEKILEEVRKERPNSAEANHFLGRALLVKHTNLAEAMRYLELAVNIDSNRAEYLLYVGWAANELAQPAKATAALNKAIELDHELGDAYWQRGILLQKQGATMDALADLKTALEKRPSRFEAYATVALCYGDLQKWADAEGAWRHAIAGDDGNAEWHYRLGKVLTSHGGAAAALPELERSVEIAEGPDQLPMPWLYDAHFLLGEALRSRPPSKAKAIEHYKRFLELAPRDNAYIKDARAALLGLGERQ